MLHTGPEYPLAHGGKVAIIALLPQFFRGQRLRQKRLESCVRFETLAYGVVEPAVIKSHACLIAIKGGFYKTYGAASPRKNRHEFKAQPNSRDTQHDTSPGVQHRN